MDLGSAAELAARVTTVLFLGLALVALRVQRRQRDAASKWLVLAFAALALASVLSRSPLPDLVPAFDVVVLLSVLAFPLLLLQFTSAFDRLSRPVRLVPAGAFVVLAVWTVVIVPLPGIDRSTSETAWLVTFLAFFVLVNLVVAFHLWRAGRDQPTIARRRMRTLALATVLISVALLVSGGTGDDAATRLATHLVSWVSTLLFGLAFLPPAIVRASWRAREEDELYRAALRLLAATDAEEVAEVLLPHVTRVVGGHDAVLQTTDGEVLARYGEPPAGGTGEALEVALSRVHLRVGVSPYTPFFGEDEARLLLRLGLLADLALDRAQLLQREQAAREEVEAVNAELEAFVYSASHDLKTPLLTILGFLDVLGESEESLAGPDAPFYLSRIRTNAAYMQELIGDLLELSRIGRVEMVAEPIDLHEVVEEVAEGVRAAHPAVTVAVPERLPVVLLNHTRARQLLGNLLENAARYGGRPDVRVEVLAAHADDRLVLRVVDDGVGVPAEHRERVFGVFERLSSAEGGTGIGLAICRKIVAELGGTIAFVDRRVGAEVRIELPASLLVAADDYADDRSDARPWRRRSWRAGS